MSKTIPTSERLGNIAQELVDQFVRVVARLTDPSDREYVEAMLLPVVVGALKVVQQYEWSQAESAKTEWITVSLERFAAVRDRQWEKEQTHVDRLRRQLRAHGIEPESCVTSRESAVQITEQVNAWRRERELVR